MSCTFLFIQEGLRMLVSQDLDCTSTLYIQLSFKFITKGKCLDNFIIAIWNSKYCMFSYFLFFKHEFVMLVCTQESQSVLIPCCCSIQ